MTFVHFTDDLNSPETQAIIKCWEIFHTLPKLIISYFGKEQLPKYKNVEIGNNYTNYPEPYIRVNKNSGKSPEEIYFWAKDKLMNL